MSILINTAPTAALEITYNALIKYVKQYLHNPNLKSKFDVFESDEILFGNGFEINLILGATANTTTTNNEHGRFNANIVTVFSTEDIEKQYAVTIDEVKLSKCVGDEAKLRAYAGELAESLMQGWIDDKNTAVFGAINAIATATGNTYTVTLGTDTEKYATDMLTALKAKVESMAEGWQGSEYGNSAIGNKRIATERIALIMSPETSATLDTFGFAKSFNAEFLQTANVTRVVTNRMSEGVICVTDMRNVQLHKWYHKDVTIQNSNGSYNQFMNIGYRVDAMKTSAGVVVFPYINILTEEAEEETAGQQ